VILVRFPGSRASFEIFCSPNATSFSELNAARQRARRLFRIENTPMMRLAAQLFHDERGQDLIEYALLAAFISLVATAAISAIGVRVNDWYTGYGATIGTVPGGSGS